MIVTDVAARAVKVSIPIADADFPVGVIPPKGAPGSAKSRVGLRLRTPEGVEFTVEPAAKSLQRALELARAAPGGFWVAQGRVGPGGVLSESGVIYQPPSVKQTEAPPMADVGL